jgi:hypothetical protein
MWSSAPASAPSRFIWSRAGASSCWTRIKKVERTVAVGQHFGTRTLREDRRWRFDAVAAEPTTLVAVSARVFETLEGSGLLEAGSDSATAAFAAIAAAAAPAPAAEQAAATPQSETILVNLPPRNRPAPAPPG